MQPDDQIALDKQTRDAETRDVSVREPVEEALRTVADVARCVLWYADVEDRGGPLAHWDTRLVSEDAARRVMPVALAPGENYLQAAYHSRIYADEAAYNALVQAQLNKNEGFGAEFQCRMADGSIRWFHEEVHIEPTGEHRWRAVGVAVDITEQKQLEERVHAAQERLEHVVGSSPAVLFLLARTGRDLTPTWMSGNIEAMRRSCRSPSRRPRLPGR